MFLGVRSFVMVQSSGVEPPASGFWSPPFTVASRLQPHSTEDKTTRLMMKQLSTARNKEIHRVIQEREEGERRYRWSEGEKGKLKGKGPVKPVMKSLSENAY